MAWGSVVTDIPVSATMAAIPSTTSSEVRSSSEQTARLWNEASEFWAHERQI